MSLVFRLDGGGAVVPMPGGERDAGPGTIVVLNCSENVHFVAHALRKYVKSNCHINCVDERQIVEWRSILEAMNAGEGVFAAATVRED